MLSTIYWWSTVHEIEDLNPYLGTGWTVKMVCLIWGNILIHPTQKWPIVWSILTVHSKRLGVIVWHWHTPCELEGGREKAVWHMSVWRLRWINGSWTFSKKKKKHKVELVEGVFGLNRMTQFGSLGILWLRIRWAYFETASKGNSNYKRTRISKGNYMWLFFFFFLMG